MPSLKGLFVEVCGAWYETLFFFKIATPGFVFTWKAIILYLFPDSFFPDVAIF